MNLKNCHYCGTEGVLVMSDGRCPHCKETLVEANKDSKESCENRNHQVDNVNSERSNITNNNSASKEPEKTIETGTNNSRSQESENLPGNSRKAQMLLTLISWIVFAVVLVLYYYRKQQQQEMEIINRIISR